VISLVTATAKPRKIKALSSTIASLFQRQLSAEEVALLVQSLANRNYLAIAGTKVSYELPDLA
jgi:hypothetical protein